MKKILCTLLLAVVFCIQGRASGEITIGGKTYSVDTLASYNVGPGTHYTKLSLPDASLPLLVYFLEADVTNPYVKFKAETSTGLMTGMEQISSIAKRKSTPGNVYFAGTNADFYNTQTGEPINGFITGGVMGRKPYAGRELIGVTDTKSPVLDLMTFDGKVVNGAESFTITNTNIGRGTNQLILFNYLQGASTGTNIYGTEVLVELVSGDWSVNSNLSVKVVSKEDGVGNMIIPSDKAVLSGNGTAKAFLDKINVGDVISLNLGYTLNSQPSIMYNLQEVVGGDRIILKNGEITDNDWAERHPRTSMGYSQDGKKIYFCVVDGRSQYSAGVTTKILGELMRSAGAWNALNLDGGGSSGMYIKDYDLVNMPSDVTERRVSNAFFAVSTAPADNTIASLSFMKSRYEVPVYSTMKPTIVGYNQYGEVVNIDVPVTFSCPQELGTIDDLGFTASGAAVDNLLTASYQGVNVSVPVSVKNEGTVAIVLDSILLDTKREYVIDIVSTLNLTNYPINPKALTWTIDNPSVCSINDGVLRGLSTGVAEVVGTFRDVSDTLLVRVQAVDENPYDQTFFDASTITLTGSSTLKDLSLTNADLPQGWNNGAKLSYKYASGRLSALKLTFLDEFLYSLPDSVSFTLNTNESTFSNITMAFTANNEFTTKLVDLKNPPVGEDVVISVALKDLYDVSNFAIYPIKLSYINLSLTDSKHTKDKVYDVYLKDIKLYYKDYPFSGIEDVITDGGGYLKVFPNPVTEGFINVELTSGTNEAVQAEVYSITGQLIKSVDLGVPASNIVTVPLYGISAGAYLLKVKEGKAKAEVAKFIIAK